MKSEYQPKTIEQWHKREQGWKESKRIDKEWRRIEEMRIKEERRAEEK